MALKFQSKLKLLLIMYTIYLVTNLVNPKDGSIKHIKRRKTNVLRMMEWFLLDLVQWLSHWSDLITNTGNNAAAVHNNNVGINSDKIGLY